MSESDVQKSAIEFLWHIGWLVLRINSGAITQTDPQTGRKRHHKFCTWYALGTLPQSAGVSDILALEPGGRLWVIECKAPGKLENLTEGQKNFQAEARERGAVVITIDSPDTLILAVEKMRRRVIV